MARPSKFRPEFVKVAQKMCELGATDIEIADALDIEVRTLYRWKAENEPFCQALKAGKSIADERVERSLFARANGYEHAEVHISNYQGVITQTPIRKIYPPDTAAAIFWLKNRKPAEWREKQEIEHSGSIAAGMTDDQLAAIINGAKPKS